MCVAAIPNPIVSGESASAQVGLVMMEPSRESERAPVDNNGGVEMGS